MKVVATVGDLTEDVVDATSRVAEAGFASLVKR